MGFDPIHINRSEVLNAHVLILLPEILIDHGAGNISPIF